MAHISENCYGNRSDQHSIKEGLVGDLDNRYDVVNKYKKSEHKWKKYLKSLKKQNKMLYIIANNSISLRELKKIKNIQAKASKKCSYPSSDSYSSGLYSDSSLSRDSD